MKLTQQTGHGRRILFPICAIGLFVVAALSPIPAAADVDHLYIFDYPGYVDCGSATTLTYEFEFGDPSSSATATSGISLDFTYDDTNLTWASGGTTGDIDTGGCSDSSGTITCDIIDGPTGGGAYTLTATLDFTLDCAGTPYAGILDASGQVDWTSGGGGSVSASEKTFAGDNCMDDQVGSSYSCVAQDVKIRQLFINRTDIIDGCTSSDDDFVSGELIAGIQTNSTERYDIGVWVNVEGGSGRTGTCAAENLFDERELLLPHGETVADSTYLPDTDGNGPYRNLDETPRNVGDDCGDTRSDEAGDARRSFGVRSLSCTDSDGDGFADAGYCVAWQNNANQGSCYFLEDALPNTNSKCYCGIATFGGVSVPDLTCDLTCQGVTGGRVRPGQAFQCTASFTNDSTAGTADYVRFRVEDEYTYDASYAGTFTSITKGRATTLATSTSEDSAIIETPSNNIIWTPYATATNPPAEDYGEFAPGVARTVTFTYTVEDTPTSADGSVTIAASTYWSSDNNPFDTPDVYQDAMDYCTVTYNFGPTWVHLSSFDAYEDAGGVVVAWETDAESGSLGFHVLRLNSNGEWQRINDSILPAIQNTPGATYRFFDENAPLGVPLEYKVIDVDRQGFEDANGPFRFDSVRRATSSDPAMVDLYSATARKPSPATANRLEAARRAEVMAATKARRTAADRVKIATGEAGVYRVEARQIADALGKTAKQVTQAIATGKVAMSNLGDEVAWTPSHDGKAVLFVADAVDTAYTRHNAYWLDLDRGLQMDSTSGGAATSPVGEASFAFTSHFEQENIAAFDLASNPHDDYWFWQLIMSASSSANSGAFPFEAAGVADVAATGTLALQIWAVSDGSADVTVNQAQVGTVSWTGTGAKTLDLDFLQSHLTAGGNEIALTGTAGAFFLNSFDVTYARAYQAHNDSLRVPGGTEQITIDGFTSPQISVIEASAGLAPRVVSNLEITQSQSGEYAGLYSVSFAPGTPDAQYFAVADSGGLHATSVSGAQSSNLMDRKNRADYLIVTSRALAGAALELADYRESSGFDTKVVVFDNIMNEFNHGIFDPEAVRDFLAYTTTTWATAPRYVTLVGKGHFDYKDNLGQGGNHVPAIMAVSDFGLVASDNAYADLVGNDSVPELAIGRIPALTAAEVHDYVAKLSAYENGADTSWANAVMMVADNPDSSGDFPADSDDLSAFVPGSLAAQKIYMGEPYTADETRQLLLDGLNSGALVMSYIGHGSMTRLASEGIFLSSDVASLTNGERLPMVAALTCWVNFFAYPGFASLGEDLVAEADGGAVAVWSASGLSENSKAVRLGEYFFDELFGSGDVAVGDAVVGALERLSNAGGNKSTLAMYNFLGDPALTLVDAAK